MGPPSATRCNFFEKSTGAKKLLSMHARIGSPPIERGMCSSFPSIGETDAAVRLMANALDEKNKHAVVNCIWIQIIK